MGQALGHKTLMKAKIYKHILTEVVRRVGTKMELARRLKISRQAVSKWDQIPVAHVRKISEMTKIPLKVLRPDIYG